jgi:hypothetical protein
VSDEEEVLSYGRGGVPRRVRLIALIAAALGLAAFVVVWAWPDPGHTPLAAASISQSLHAPPRSVPPVASPVTREWPTAPGACLNDVELPIVSSVPVQGRTGLRVLLGGHTLRTIDFDSGHTTNETVLRRGAFVSELALGSTSYAVTAACDWTAGQRVFRLTSDGYFDSEVSSIRRAWFVVFDGAQPWRFAYPREAQSRGAVVELDAGGRSVRLPIGFAPEAITDGVVVSSVGQGVPGAGSIQLVDVNTGSVRYDLGYGRLLAVGHGLVVWAAGCDVASSGPCIVHWRSVRGGATATYRLPRPPGFAHGIISPDGREVAFPLERAHQDARYDTGHPVPPTAVAILHLDTRTLDVVPGVELAAKSDAGLAFSPDGRWLVIALDAGTKTRLLAWRPGMPHAFETTPVRGPVLTPSPVAVLPNR